MILIDSNIPMYLVGSAHPHRPDAQRLLKKLVSERQLQVADAEVLRELLHRYVAIARGQSSLRLMLGLKCWR